MRPKWTGEGEDTEGEPIRGVIAPKGGDLGEGEEVLPVLVGVLGVGDLPVVEDLFVMTGFFNFE
jgi:hypothetical protein